MAFGDEADNMHYLAKSHQVILGFGNGGVAVIDALENKLLGTVKVDGHPEGQLRAEQLSLENLASLWRRLRA